MTDRERSDDEVAKLENYFRDPVIGEGLLRRGDSGIACRNLRIAVSNLRRLDVDLLATDNFDPALEKQVLAFQKAYGHNVVDGQVGPGTRRRLAESLLSEGKRNLFDRMKPPGPQVGPQVFLSYCWQDSDIVNKFDQWLRDSGVRVLRDIRDFLPGSRLPDQIRTAIENADKVIAVYSRESKARDWPAFEIKAAEEAERRGQGLLIYLVLDETPLPQPDSDRLAVRAKGRRFEDVALELLRGVKGLAGEPARYEYDLDEVL